MPLQFLTRSWQVLDSLAWTSGERTELRLSSDLKKAAVVLGDLSWWPSAWEVVGLNPFVPLPSYTAPPQHRQTGGVHRPAPGIYHVSGELWPAGLVGCWLRCCWGACSAHRFGVILLTAGEQPLLIFPGQDGFCMLPW